MTRGARGVTRGHCDSDGKALAPVMALIMLAAKVPAAVVALRSVCTCLVSLWLFMFFTASVVWESTCSLVTP
jgi:hypothetical protein